MDIAYKKLNTQITPEALAQLKTSKIIFESTNQDKLKGRYSIVVLDDFGSVTLDNHQLMIKTEYEEKEVTEKPYDYLKSLVNKYYTDIEDEHLRDLPFIAGFIGTCSFDLVGHEFEKLQEIKLSDHRDHDVKFYLVENTYVFDHYKDELYVIATNLFSNKSKDELFEEVEKRIEDLKHINLVYEKIEFNTENRKIKTNIPEDEFIETIKALKKKITEGDMFQVVPSRIYSYKHHFYHHLQQLTFQLYQKLKRQNPSPYMFYINKDIPIIVGSSPESFVKVKDGWVYTNPIAGTIKRGKDLEEDEKNSELLLNDEKERSEHSMLVDLGRNDIHRISKIGTSKITKLMEIEKYEHVMHIVSEVVGELKEGLSPMSVIASLLPTGTVFGAPKLRAIQRIYEANPHKRGIYSGGVGYINCNHNLDFALAIRTMLIDDNQVDIEAGCGVVYDSIPEKELEETKLKAKSLLEVTP
ncbi:anthranilate synthase component I [Staphylococcus caprae]|uniref:anthranilate synthase component I n=1 Tax=Staphylococcus caprae TaxID=29380 RepID=UPI001C8406CD|nr:anthranilate synthase component I [Staphylococcus caprae]MBX5318174.1 anthranilate synthase component I [Staphylococcus caprae]